MVSVWLVMESVPDVAMAKDLPEAVGKTARALWGSPGQRLSRSGTVREGSLEGLKMGRRGKEPGFPTCAAPVQRSIL